jgi:hypothetical protein
VEPLGTTWELWEQHREHALRILHGRFKRTHAHVGYTSEVQKQQKGKIMCQTYADKIWTIHGEKFGNTCTTTTMVRTCKP